MRAFASVRVSCVCMCACACGCVRVFARRKGEFFSPGEALLLRHQTTPADDASGGAEGARRRRPTPAASRRVVVDREWRDRAGFEIRPGDPSQKRDRQASSASSIVRYIGNTEGLDSFRISMYQLITQVTNFF